MDEIHRGDWLVEAVMRGIRRRVEVARHEIEKEAQTKLSQRVGEIVDQAALEAAQYYELERFGDRLVITVRRPAGDET